METMIIRLKSRYGEVITCSIKSVEKYESGRVEYNMDNKKCNDFHNSQFDLESSDCRVRSVSFYPSGQYDVYASYKNNRGNYRQGAQAIDVELLPNI